LFVLLKIALVIWFKKIVVTGKENIPVKGPAIFASNHPNMILDPILVAGTCNRLDGHFWAASFLFKGPLGIVLKSAGGVPVSRRQDSSALSEEERERSIDQLFELSYKILEKKEALYIFPEGVSYTSPHLMPLKTGTARLAIGFAKKFRHTLKIVAPIIPVGLNYVAKDLFRSKVIVQYGEPIYPTDEELDSQDGYTKLTHRIEAALMNSTINVETWEDLLIIDLAHKIYASRHSLSIAKDIQLLHRFTDAYQKIHNEPVAAELKQKLIRYKSFLDQYGIDDSVFVQDNFQVILKNLFQKSVRYLVLAIIALPGEIIHMPLHFFANKLVHNHPYIEEFCQRKFAVLVFCVPLWYSIFSAIIYMLFDSFWFYASLIGFPVFGYIYVMTEEKNNPQHLPLDVS